MFTTEEQFVIDQATRILDSKIRSSPALTSSNATRTYLRVSMATLEREVFRVIFLDSQNRVITVEDLFFGTIDGTSVHPREVVKAALRHNAAAAILAHNHPSGMTEPSQADINITRHLKDVLAMVGVRILDHVVVGIEDDTSMAERGLI